MKNNLLQFPLNIVLSYLLLIYLFVHPSDSPFLTTSFQSQSWPTSIEMKNLLLAFLAIPLTSCSISPLLYMQWERIKCSGSIRHDYNFFFFFQKKRHKYSLLKLSNKPFAVCPNFSYRDCKREWRKATLVAHQGQISCICPIPLKNQMQNHDLMWISFFKVCLQRSWYAW